MSGAKLIEFPLIFSGYGVRGRLPDVFEGFGIKMETGVFFEIQKKEYPVKKTTSDMKSIMREANYGMEQESSKKDGLNWSSIQDSPTWIGFTSGWQKSDLGYYCSTASDGLRHFVFLLLRNAAVDIIKSRCAFSHSKCLIQFGQSI